MKVEIFTVEIIGYSSVRADEMLAIQLEAILKNGGSIVGIVFMPTSHYANGCYKIAAQFFSQPNHSLDRPEVEPQYCYQILGINR